MLNSFYYRRTC